MPELANPIPNHSLPVEISSAHVLPELTGATGFQVIDEFLRHLAALGKISSSSVDPIASALRQRERSMSTGIGFGIAIPHAATPFIREITLALGRSLAGIDFNALDQQPVRLVVLVLVPEKEMSRHLPLLAGLSRFLRNADIRKALENAPNAQAMADILNQRP